MKFDAVYLRMTMWYVVIIMTISLLFSVWVYNQARSELRTGLSKVVELKPITPGYPQGGSYSGVVNGELSNSRGRLLNRLVLMNVGVLVVGSVASYWLARRTMRPIEESIEAQERFTADASHELRTPLAAMKAEIEVGLRDEKNLSRADAVALLKSNLEEVERLGGLADGLLALTQSDSSAALSPLALDEVVGKTVTRLQPLAYAKNITIVSELQAVRALADEAAVDKIIGILLDNAIKYSPEKTSITVRILRKDDAVLLEVQDEGRGIKAGELPHIFERFYRADTSRTKAQVPGHGLGLSIAQKLAHDMNGRITAASTPGKGSVFALELPVA